MGFERTVPAFSLTIRGYEPEEVDAHVLAMADHVEAATTAAVEAERRAALLEAQVSALRRRLDELECDPYRRLGAEITDLLSRLGAEVVRIRQHGEDEAAAAVREARRRRDVVLATAQQEAARIVAAGEARRAEVEGAAERLRQRILGLLLDDTGDSARPDTGGTEARDDHDDDIVIDLRDASEPAATHARAPRTGARTG